MEEENGIKIGKYLYYDTEHGRFFLTSDAQHIIYREKGIICSYSGSSEWSHDFFCQIVDIYSGVSIYNYAIGSVDHKKEIDKKIKEGKIESITTWVNKVKDDEWWELAIASFEYVFENLPNYTF